MITELPEPAVHRPGSPCRPRLLATLDADYVEHTARLGPLPVLGPRDLVDLAASSGLTGRGGAAFPTGRKLASLLTARRTVVIGNAAEGEPASSKDELLLRRAPHLVLDGLLLAAQALGGQEIYLYGPSAVLASSVRRAVAEREDARFVRLVAAPDAFVSGQDTAVVQAVQGRPALPRTNPPATYVSGVRGLPTLVQNVETAAHLALIARYGAYWFRQAGTDEEPGTRLHTVSGAVRHPGVYELPGGASLDDAVAAAGGPAEALQALLVGGYHGGWVPWDPITRALPLSRSALRDYDAAPGAGVVIALPARRCGLRAGADVAAYLAGQNAGQCGPCRYGLPSAAAVLERLAEGRAGPRVRTELDRLLRMVDGRGACSHPSGTVRLIRSTLRTFHGEVDRHLAGHCSAAPVPGEVRR
ncbi:MAG TPA: NADH-ubiquinone oxidoreductase-F iron-sulfur binding region domain-containing protein [Jatrophihabitans sp.]|nr:NADH-ubiquinone oxidoreductase-F iron-sulfur binding region domain-containing protein [Jatrophihabitans sp.]